MLPSGFSFLVLFRGLIPLSILLPFFFLFFFEEKETMEENKRDRLEYGNIGKS